MQGEIEKRELGARDLVKDREELEKKIRQEVESEFPLMPGAAKDAIIESRLKILEIPQQPILIHGDLGNNTSRRIKDNLFEK